MKIKIEVFPFLLFIFAVVFCAYLGFSFSFKKFVSTLSFVLVFIAHIIRVFVGTCCSFTVALSHQLICTREFIFHQILLYWKATSKASTFLCILHYLVLHGMEGM